jgi:hypothetical protein
MVFCFGLVMMTMGGIAVYRLWPTAEPIALGVMLFGAVLAFASRRRSRRTTSGSPDPHLDLGGYPMSMLRSNRFMMRR